MVRGDALKTNESDEATHFDVLILRLVGHRRRRLEYGQSQSTLTADI